MKTDLKIPEGWSVKKLGDVCSTFSGGTPLVDNSEFYNGDIPFIRSGEIHLDRTALFLTEKGVRSSSAKKVQKGDLLYALYGATSGEVDISKIDGAINQAILCIRSNKINLYILCNILRMYKNKILQKYLQGGQGNLSADIVKSLSLKIPPLPEQKKIAEVLGCWDEGIEKLSQLIDKKKEQKKALMQKLLTGKHRLPGFTTPWHEVKLGNITTLKKGNQINKLDMLVSAKYPVLNGGVIPSGYTDKWNTEANTITISEGGNSCGFINLMKEKFWSGGHCYTLENLKLHSSFLFQILKFNEKIIMNLRVGSGLPNIQKISLIDFKLYIPSDIKEQQAIADVLETADKEIRLLNAKLDALKEQKKGLMQQLLTGKKRVKVN